MIWQAIKSTIQNRSLQQAINRPETKSRFSKLSRTPKKRMSPYLSCVWVCVGVRVRARTHNREGTLPRSNKMTMLNRGDLQCTHLAETIWNKQSCNIHISDDVTHSIYYRELRYSMQDSFCSNLVAMNPWGKWPLRLFVQKPCSETSKKNLTTSLPPTLILHWPGTTITTHTNPDSPQ